MHIRCPHCHNAVEVVGEEQFTSVICSSCGSTFDLLPETATYWFKKRAIGHFELLEQLGTGSFGTVWKARDTQLDRLVAVKIPRRDQFDPDNVEMFLREARAAAQIRHPHIVAVHEVGREDGTLYIVSDFVQGVTLADRLTSSRFTPREAAEMLAQVAEALHHAHESGVIHRDLKPQNIMLDGEGQTYLMDFGLAKREAGEISMTVDGKILGTAAYMSPEQARGDAHHVDRRTDVYSLGVILFELLTGERPFRGNVRMLLHQVIHDPAPSPRKLNGRIPRDLETISLKCLAKEPRQRYRNAQEMVEDLRRFLTGKPIMARPAGIGERLVRWCRRRPAIAALIALSVLAPLALLGLSVFYNFKLEAEQSELSKAKQTAENRATETKTALLVARRREVDSYKALAESYHSQARAQRIALQADSPEKALDFLWRSGQLRKDSELATAGDSVEEVQLRAAADLFWNGHLPKLRSEAARWLMEGSLISVSQLKLAAQQSVVFALSSDHRQVARCEPTPTALTITLIDIASGRTEATVNTHLDESDRPQCLAASIAGKQLVLVSSHSQKNEFRVSWIDLSTGKYLSSKPLGAFKNTAPQGFEFRLLADRFVVGGFGEGQGVWDAQTGSICNSTESTRSLPSINKELV